MRHGRRGAHPCGRIRRAVVVVLVVVVIFLREERRGLLHRHAFVSVACSERQFGGWKVEGAREGGWDGRVVPAAFLGKLAAVLDCCGSLREMRVSFEE